MPNFFFEKDTPDPFVENNAINLVETPFAEAIKASVSNSIRQNSPLNLAHRSIELMEAKQEQQYVVNRDDTDPLQWGRPVEGEYKQRKVLTREQANEQFGIAGELNFDGNITEDAAKIIKTRKEEEIQIRDTIANAHGIVKNGAMFGTELVAALLDPVNFAANFVPVVGQARMARMVERFGRHGARLLRGAAEGALGQGIIEPFAYNTHQAELADYTMYDSLKSVLMGGLTGAGLHEGFGVVGDAIHGIKRRTATQMHKTAVGQLAEGRDVNISPLLDHDPNVVNSADAISEDDFFNSLKKQVDDEADVAWKLQHPEPVKSPEQVQQQADYLNEPDVTGPTAQEVNVENSLNIDGLTQIAGQLGSNKGGLYLDNESGVSWYIKWPKTDDHVKNEYLVNLLYRLAGINVPENRIVTAADGTLGIASKWVDVSEPVTDFSKLNPDQLLELHEGFVADAWLANWDVMKSENLHLDKTTGKFIRLDQGGGLKYRAQGELKGINESVQELQSLIDNNPEVYGKLSEEMKDISASNVFKITKKDIEKALDLAGYVKGTKERNETASLIFGRLHDLETKLPYAAKAHHYKNNEAAVLWTKEDAVAKLESYIASAFKKIKNSKFANKINNALNNYQGSSSHVNKYLRGTADFSGNMEGLKTLKDEIRHIDIAMKKFAFPENIVLWRGVDYDAGSAQFTDIVSNDIKSGGDYSAVYQVDIAKIHEMYGKQITDKGFMSTSIGKSQYVKGFPIHIKLEVPAGYNAAFPEGAHQHASSFKGTEVEAVLPRGTTYIPTRAYFKENKLIIEAKVLPKKGPVAAKKAMLKKTPDQTVKEIENYNQQPSSAAKTDQMDLEPGVKGANEVVKPVEKMTDEEFSAAVKYLENQITDLSGDKSISEALLQKQQGKLSISKEEMKFVEQLKEEMFRYDDQIKQAKEKMTALAQTFNCVVENF